MPSWLSVNGVAMTNSVSHLRLRSTALGDRGRRLSSAATHTCVRVAVRQMSLAGIAPPPWAGVGRQSRQLVYEITQFRDTTSLRTSYTIYPSCLGFANDASGRPELFDVEIGLKTSNPVETRNNDPRNPEMCPSVHRFIQD